MRRDRCPAFKTARGFAHGQKLSAWVVPTILLAVQATAASDEDCRRVQDPAERLACYDRVNPVVTPPEPAPVPSARTTPIEAKPSASREAEAADETQESMVTETIRREPVVVPTSPQRVTEQPGQPAVQPRRPARPEAEFGLPPPEREPPRAVTEIKGTITNVVKQWPSQRYRYTLDNGQTWVQTKAKSVWVREGDVVTVRKRRLTYYMLSEGGTSFGVERVE